MVLRCIPAMPWHVMSEPDFVMAHPAEWWVRPQPQQDLTPMVGLQGTCEMGGIPVACWQWARGAAEPAPLAHGWVSPRHINSLPVKQLPVPQPELGASVQAIHEDMEQDEEYLRVSCGYTLITKWEWECVKRTNPRTVGAAGWENALNVSWPLDRCQLLVLGNDLQSSCSTYTRTGSLAWTRWISIHSRASRMKFLTCYPSSRQLLGPGRMPFHTWLNTVRPLVS